MMTLGQRLKKLRRELGLSQEALGAQGFVSTPGWVKIENGQRQASEKLIDRVCRWLVEDKYLRLNAGRALQDELLTLKYLGSRSNFVVQLATGHALRVGLRHLLDPQPATKPTRERPPVATAKSRGGKAVAR